MASCWCVRHETDGYASLSDALAALDWDEATAICLLPDGHTGPHEWAPMGEVEIAFVPSLEVPDATD